MDKKPRYQICRVSHAKYPVLTVDTETGEIVGHWYKTSIASARDYVRDLNSGKRQPALRTRARGDKERIAIAKVSSRT